MTADTSQFYLAQTYLPLPPAERDKVADASGAEGCAGNAVVARPRAPGERFGAQVLAGMTLHVTQTSYAASRADEAVPLIAEWRWTVPTDAVSDPKIACADAAGAVPSWGRQDLLRVRALLSGAQLLHENPPEARSPIYFAEAMAASCATASGTGVGLGCAERPFLDKFVAGLELTVRGQAKIEVGKPISAKPGQAFDPKVPVAVLADTDAPGENVTGYGKWYAGLSGFRFPADLFGSGAQAERCRGPLADSRSDGETPLAQDASVCKFAQTNLDWSAPTAALRLPGDTLRAIPRLSLLRSGDPLLLFQPRSYIDPLDLGNGKRCNGDPACLLADRTMQGFTDIELLIPVLSDRGQRRWVPVGMTIAAYENANGVVVTRVRRSTDWLPGILAFEDSKTRDTAKLAGTRRRVDLRFYDASKKADLGGGVAIREAKGDLLFAPGDIITTTRRP